MFLFEILLVFQQRDRQDSQNSKNQTFYRTPVTTAQCIIGVDKHPHSAILINYSDDDYAQIYVQNEEAFRTLTKDDMPKSYLFDVDFRSSNNIDDIGYNLYVFDISYQKNSESAQPNKIDIKFFNKI